MSDRIQATRVLYSVAPYHRWPDDLERRGVRTKGQIARRARWQRDMTRSLLLEQAAADKAVTAAQRANQAKGRDYGQETE